MSADGLASPAADIEVDAWDAALSRIRRWVLALSLALVVAASAALAYWTEVLFKAELTPEVMAKADAVAEFLVADVQRALGYGIPLNKLVGVPEYFDMKHAAHPEIDFIALLGANGEPLHISGSFPFAEEEETTQAAARLLLSGVPGAAEAALEFFVVLEPIQHDGVSVAAIAVDINPHFVDQQLQELVYDVVVILLVSLFLAFEIAVALLAFSGITATMQLLGLVRAAADGDLRRRLAYAASDELGRAVARFNATIDALHQQYARLAARIRDDIALDLRPRLQAIGERFGLVATGPVETRIAASAAHVRLPLFVFIMAEELQKSFLPLYVATLKGQVAWIAPEVLIGLPISVYMLTLALMTPFAGSWTDRYGPRRIFVFGLVPALVGFVGAAVAATVAELIVFRALTAGGYAMCTIAAQGFIVQVTPSHARTRGVSTFVGVLMAASICGTAVGGILADRIGFRLVFVSAAVLTLMAGALALRMLSANAAGAVERRERGVRLGDLYLMLSNWRFVALVLFAAIPGKIVLTGFLFYAVPLYLASLGSTEAEIGRIMMSYSLVIVFLGPWLSKIADEKGYGWWMVFAGTLLSGLAMVLLWERADVFGVVAAVLVVALAHAASISPQVALVPEICRREIEKIGQTTVLGILRMLERVGSVVGPLLVAGLVARFGFVEGLALVGMLLAFLSPLLLTVLISYPRSQSD